MYKPLAWVLVVVGLAFGGYRIWDRNVVADVVPPAPVAIEQPVKPPAVQPPVPAPAPAPVVKTPRKPAPKPPADPKPRVKAKPAPAPAAEPAPAPRYEHQRGAPNGSAAALPVSCETVRWYAKNAPAQARAAVEAYHPTAAQISAAKACLKG